MTLLPVMPTMTTMAACKAMARLQLIVVLELHAVHWTIRLLTRWMIVMAHRGKYAIAWDFPRFFFFLVLSETDDDINSAMWRLQ
jgi:hypothetical protein